MSELPDDRFSEFSPASVDDDAVAAVYRPYAAHGDLIACTECRRQWLDPSEHWRVYIWQPDMDENGENDACLMCFYCPRCAQREFGEPGRRSTRQ